MVAIRVDYNSRIGTGHLNRCLSIAYSLRDKGFNVCFIVSKDSEPSVVRHRGFVCEIVEESEYNNWCLEDEIKRLLLLKIKVVIIDSYYAKTEWIALIHRSIKVIYIDDLLRKELDVDVIINYNIEAVEQEYFNPLYPQRVHGIGIGFFPLNHEIKTEKKKKINRDVAEVLITSGSTDPLLCIDCILSGIQINEYPAVLFKVIIGKYTSEEYNNTLRHKWGIFSNIKFLPWGQDMKKVYSTVDLVISPGSTTVYEALSFGVPCITYEFAKNQHAECISLQEKGIAPYVGDFTRDLKQDISNRVNNTFRLEMLYPTRYEQYILYKDLFDGNGTKRIAEMVERLINEESL